MMQVGSLVVLKKNYTITNEDRRLAVKYGMILPVRDVIYTVCDLLLRYGNWMLRLEEITNPIPPSWPDEPGYDAEEFEEVQPPMDIEAIIEDAIFVPVELI